MRESRIKKSILNAKVNLLFYAFMLLLSFFSRKVYIEHLGVDFVGLTSTLYNLLAFLNLAELGICSAVGYCLYKPLYDRNNDEIINIVSSLAYIYRIVGSIILAMGVLCSCFLPLFFEDSGQELTIVYLAYFIFLFCALLSYFVNYKQTLLSADQKNYVVTLYSQTASIFKIIIQICLLYLVNSAIVWLVVELLFGIVHSIILNWKIKRTYPWLSSSVKHGRRIITKYRIIFHHTKRLFVHQIAGVVQSQLAPILLFAFVSLSMVTLYGNYVLIANQLQKLASKLLGSTEAAVGHLVAQGNREHNIDVYFQLLSIRYYIGALLVYGLYNLSNPFISIWLGSSFILDGYITSAIYASSFIMLTRGVNDQFIFAFGLFGDVWAPLLELVIQVTACLVLGMHYGLHGVVLGNLAGMLTVVTFWKPYFLFREGFQRNVFVYWKQVSLLLVAIMLSWSICYMLLELVFTPIQPETYIQWCMYSVQNMMLYLLVSIVVFYVVSSCFRSTLKRLIFLAKSWKFQS